MGRRFTEDDWEELKYTNVGSIMEPVTRADAYYKAPPKPIKVKSHKRRIGGS